MAMVTKKSERANSRTARPRRKRALTLAERIAALGKRIPAEEQAKMPRDGAANHDHYIYGTPKQY